MNLYVDVFALPWGSVLIVVLISFCSVLTAAVSVVPSGRALWPAEPVGNNGTPRHV